MHDVDEDMRAITRHGGESGLYWPGTTSGVFLRVMGYSPTDFFDVAASRCRHLKLIIYYTDHHDVDEDLRTIIRQGGSWGYAADNVGMAGITDLGMTNTSTTVWDIVASLKK